MKYNYVYYGIEKNNYLKGKIIDKVGFTYDTTDEEKNQLIIKFTDGTFICVGIRSNYDDSFRFHMDNMRADELSSYYPHPEHYMDVDGNIHLDYYLQMQVDMGLIEPMSDEDLKKMIKEEIKKREEVEYKQYLKLKDKFENKKINN